MPSGTRTRAHARTHTQIHWDLKARNAYTDFKSELYRGDAKGKRNLDETSKAKPTNIFWKKTAPLKSMHILHRHQAAWRPQRLTKGWQRNKPNKIITEYHSSWISNAHLILIKREETRGSFKTSFHDRCSVIPIGMSGMWKVSSAKLKLWSLTPSQTRYWDSAKVASGLSISKLLICTNLSLLWNTKC